MKNIYYYLYNNENKQIENINKDDIMDKLYYQEVSLPTYKQIEESNDKAVKGLLKKYGKESIEMIKVSISKVDNKIPLYDVYSENMYVIDKHNVYNRVVHQYYRFPDKQLYDDLIEKKKVINEKIIKEEYDETTIALKIRIIRKIELIIEFLDSFDLEELYSTYMRVFYLYSVEVGKNITLCQRPSFMSHYSHVRPYYTRSEVINLALNMGVKLDNNYYGEEKIVELCKIIKKNDISASILLKHQEYMIDKNNVGLVQYYSLHGSYIMNQYLRNLVNYPYKNEYLESLIKPMWELVNNAPEFDKEYILYRFVSDDSYMRHLEIGDTYTDLGFMSTTRDPFYNSDQYKFGFILIKIKIPPNMKGVGLCVETLSHFPKEQEIILGPKSVLRLDKKDEKCKYYHTDEKFVSQVKTKYEFTYIGNADILIEDRPNYNKGNQIVNFISMEKTTTLSLEEKIRAFMNEFVSPMNQYEIKFGDNIFVVMNEYYDSTTAYKPYYAINTKNGYSMYSIYNNYVLFFIELGEDNDQRIMHVNYYVRYSTIDRNKVITDEEFITFLAGIATYFEIDRVIMHAEFMTCDIFKLDNTDEYKEYQKGTETRYVNRSISQRGYSGKIIKPKEEIIKQHFFGGNYCTDFYEYIINKKKRYHDKKILSMEIAPKFSYYELDRLRSIIPNAILKKEDRDELYQIYDKVYKEMVEKDKNNVIDFYIWIIKNKCYLISELTKKLTKIYTNNNPFEYAYYVLDPNLYLYNRGYIMTSPSYLQERTIDFKRNINSGTKNDNRLINKMDNRFVRLS